MSGTRIQIGNIGSMVVLRVDDDLQALSLEEAQRLLERRTVMDILYLVFPGRVIVIDTCELLLTSIRRALVSACGEAERFRKDTLESQRVVNRLKAETKVQVAA